MPERYGKGSAERIGGLWILHLMGTSFKRVPSTDPYALPCPGHHQLVQQPVVSTRLAIDDSGFVQDESPRTVQERDVPLVAKSGLRTPFNEKKLSGMMIDFQNGDSIE